MQPLPFEGRMVVILCMCDGRERAPEDVGDAGNVPFF